MSVAAILTAAGSGSRLGHALPKALVPLAGAPLVVHAARGLAMSGLVQHIIVTVPVDHRDAFVEAFAGAGPLREGLAVTFVVGGPSRQASVAAGLAALPVEADVVLVHDAARALAPASLSSDVIRAVRAGHRAVIPGLAVVDSVVQVVDGSAQPVDRERLRLVQTPQGFDRALLDRAHAAAADRARDERSAATDDASLCAALGEPVHVVAGHESAAKITTARDLAVAELLLQGEPS